MSDNAQRPVILIVEDEPAIRSLTREFIKTLYPDKYVTEQASNGEEGLNRLRQGWVDGLLTDHTMPVMSGDEMVRQAYAEGIQPKAIAALSATPKRFNYRKPEIQIFTKPQPAQLIAALKHIDERLSQQSP